MSFQSPQWLAIAIPVGTFVIWAWWTGHANLAPARRYLALALRLAILLALTLGLAGLSVSLPVSDQATVFVADVSSSLSASRALMQQQLEGAMSRHSSDQAGVVSVAAAAEVEQPVGPLNGFSGFQTVLNPNATNLESGLSLAGSVLPSGYRGRVVLMSDGGQTEGDAIVAARLLHARGIRVDVVPEHVNGGPDVLVDSVVAPSQLSAGERSTLSVTVRSNVDTTARITVYRDRALVASRAISVHAGVTQIAFPQPALRPGFHSYRVQVDAARDSQPANNVGSAFSLVGGAPRILVISANPGEADNVVNALRSTGVGVSVERPSQVVPSLTVLQRFASVVIVDTPAELLGQPLMDALVPFVRDLGHGLVLVGGQQAYGLGGYGQTPLEQVLPVKMDLPRRPDLPSVGVVLIVESLEANLPINVSKAAAKGVVQLLTEQDYVAVNDVPDSGGSGWAVRLRPATDKAPIASEIDGMTPGDPQSYVSALRQAANILSSSPTRLKHIILLGDGDAHDPLYRALAAAIRRRGITISTVVTNALQPSDKETMRTIASAGGGRYYEANDTRNIPRIFLHEARTVARSGVVTGRFAPRALSTSPILRDLHSIPPLGGYVATTLKSRAEMILTSGKLDPVLAAWQYGLGRTVAWTSDAAGLWSSEFMRDRQANRFWSDVVTWTVPGASSSSLFVSAKRSGGEARVSVDLPSNLGSSPTVAARLSGPASGETVVLQPVAPGRFAASFPVSNTGAYIVTVDARGAGHAALGQTGFVVSYPDEYRVGGTNLALLDAVARAGGGSLLRDPRSAWSDALPAAFQQRALAPELWLLALALVPIDVAVRRLVVSRRDLRALRGAIARRWDARAA